METNGSNNPNETKAKLDYLKELLTDRAVLSNYPGIYLHVGKILEKEILKVRSALFATYGIYTISDKDLPEPEGPKVNLVNRVYMPDGENSSFNFVGRILGPEGSTAKCLQQCLGVKIMVRGRGSMRDRKKEEANIGKPNWEHLNDKLHVVLTVEDYENRAQARLDKASEYISQFLKESLKASDRDDKVKQMQLMELSFRRELRVSWPMNYGGMFNFGLPPKPGTVFPHPTMMGFGYGYPHPPGPPPPHPPTNAMFSSLHQNPSHHPHGHPAPPPPPPGSQQPTGPPHSYGPIPGGHQANLTTTQGHGAPVGNLTHSFASTVSPGLNTTVLMGPPGPTGPYTNSHLAPAPNTTCNSAVATGQPGQAPPPNIPGALAMASMNYWPNVTSGITHLPAADFSVQTHLSTGNTPPGMNGFPAGPEENSTDGFSTSHLTSGSHPNGLCNVFMSAHSATHPLARVNEDSSTGNLLPEFVPGVGVQESCSAADGRVSNAITTGLSGLYAPTAASVALPNSGSLKLVSTTLHSGSSPPPSQPVAVAAVPVNSSTSTPPSSSFAAKQGWKSRYHSKGHYAASPLHSVAGGRSARNTVVAVSVGSQEKNNEMTNGGSQSVFEVRGKNGAAMSTNSTKANEATVKSDKKFSHSRADIKSNNKSKTMESRWHGIQPESIGKDQQSASENSSLDRIEQGMLDLSLIPDSNGQAPNDLKGASATVDTAK